MDKQKRDRQPAGNSPRSGEPQQPSRDPQHDKRESEQVKGSASDQQKTPGVQRQPGRMPLPD
jgi:hypothetical protein